MFNIFSKNHIAMSLQKPTSIVYFQLDLPHGLGAPNWDKYNTPLPRSALIELKQVPEHYNDIASSSGFIAADSYYLRIKGSVYYVSRTNPLPEKIVSASKDNLELNCIHHNKVLTRHELDDLIRLTGHSQLSLVDQINQYHDHAHGQKSIQFNQDVLSKHNVLDDELLNIISANDCSSKHSTKLDTTSVFIALLECGLKDFMGREKDYNQYAFGTIKNKTIFNPEEISESLRFIV